MGAVIGLMSGFKVRSTIKILPALFVIYYFKKNNRGVKAITKFTTSTTTQTTTKAGLYS